MEQNYNNQNILSICIPTYEMRGQGSLFLKRSFDILTHQTYKNFDIIISDHSKNDLVKELCESYQNKLTINYYRNTENYGSTSANTNNAIKKATGKTLNNNFIFKNCSIGLR